MRTVNKVILIGNITRDPLVKVKAAGAKVVVFTLATNRTFTNHQGEMMSEAEYSSCVAWGPLADRAADFLSKGKLVYVEGRLKTRTIDKEDGSRLQKTEVIISNLIFLSKREDADRETVPEVDIGEYGDFSDLDSDKF